MAEYLHGKQVVGGSIPPCGSGPDAKMRDTSFDFKSKGAGSNPAPGPVCWDGVMAALLGFFRRLGSRDHTFAPDAKSRDTSVG